MARKILKMILYFFIIFATPVYADSFDVSKDASANQYYQAVALGTEGYPDIEDIQYVRSDFMAESTSGILSTGISGYIDFDFPRRIPVVADRVYGPPGTSVDLIYLLKNSAGHSINISKVNLVLSRNNSEMGDLTDVLNISDVNTTNLLYKYSNQNLIKSGIYKQYDGIGEIPNGKEGGYILESTKIKNPLEIGEAEYIRNDDETVDISVYIRNMSKEYLNNLVFKYLTHEEKFDLGAGDEHVVKFSLSDVPEELEVFSIYNPNIKEICSVYGSPYYTYTDTNAVSVFAYRGDAIVPGASVQPARESLCVKRIPYTMSYDNWVEKFAEKEYVEEESVEEGTGESVLGVTDENIEEKSILPKTGKVSWIIGILLVVDVVLWYSWYIYESKNTNSRLCTKSSKNAKQRGL